MWFKRKGIWLGVILLLLVALLGTTVLGCIQRSQPKGWSGGTVADGTLFLGSLEGKLVAVDISNETRLWAVLLETPAPAGGGCAAPSVPGAIYGNPAVDGELVYIGGYSGKIYAVNSNSGAERWVYPRTGKLKPIVGGPVVSQGKVYIGGSSGKVYALDAATGDNEWEFQTGGEIWSTPAIVDETLYIGSFDKKLYAIDTITGKEKWAFETQGAIVAVPLIYDDTIYIGSFDRHFYAVEATEGKQIWQFPATDEDKNKPESWFWAKPVVYNNVIYAPCLDGKIYILDAKSGEELAEPIDVGSPIASSPILVDSSIIIASEEGKVYSLDTASNQVRELTSLKEEEKVHAPLSASEGTVFIHTDEDTLYAVDSETGAKRELYIE